MLILLSCVPVALTLVGCLMLPFGLVVFKPVRKRTYDIVPGVTCVMVNVKDAFVHVHFISFFIIIFIFFQTLLERIPLIKIIVLVMYSMYCVFCQ